MLEITRFTFTNTTPFICRQCKVFSFCNSFVFAPYESGATTDLFNVSRFPRHLQPLPPPLQDLPPHFLPIFITSFRSMRLLSFASAKVSILKPSAHIFSIHGRRTLWHRATICSASRFVSVRGAFFATAVTNFSHARSREGYLTSVSDQKFARDGERGEMQIEREVVIGEHHGLPSCGCCGTSLRPYWPALSWAWIFSFVFSM